MAILISDQIKFRTRNIARSKKYDLIMIKGLKHETIRPILSVYTRVKCASQHDDQDWWEKGEKVKYTMCPRERYQPFS